LKPRVSPGTIDASHATRSVTTLPCARSQSIGRIGSLVFSGAFNVSTVTLPLFNGGAAAIPSSSRRETVTSTNLLQARDRRSLSVPSPITLFGRRAQDAAQCRSRSPELLLDGLNAGFCPKPQGRGVRGLTESAYL